MVINEDILPFRLSNTPARDASEESCKFQSGELLRSGGGWRTLRRRVRQGGLSNLDLPSIKPFCFTRRLRSREYTDFAPFKMVSMSNPPGFPLLQASHPTSNSWTAKAKVIDVPQDAQSSPRVPVLLPDYKLAQMVSAYM